MNKKMQIGLGLVLAFLVIGLSYIIFKVSSGENLASAAVDCTQNTCFTSLGVTGTSQVDGAFITNGTVTNAGAVTDGSTLTVTGDVTINGGNGALVLTTTNTATSTLQAGCIQMTASSTGSPIKLVPATYSSTTATFGFGTVGFPVMAVFGTCP